MQATYVVYLKARSGFRGSLRSDTLWGTLCWAMRLLYGETALNDFLDSYGAGKTPDLLISSAFPYGEKADGSRVHFFPRPILPPGERETPAEKPSESSDLDAIKQRKKLKKVEFLPQDIFEALLQGQGENAAANLGKKLMAMLNDKEKEQALATPKVKAESVTHNRIDRLRGGTLSVDGKGQLFHVEEQFVTLPEEEGTAYQDGGLFFLVRGPLAGRDAANPGQPSVLEVLLRFLSHIGIGGDRSTGKGHFDLEVKACDFLSPPEAAQAWINLSLYSPTPDEAAAYDAATDKDEEHLRYALEDRQGQVGNQGYKRVTKHPLTMFKEGSLFPFWDRQKTYGQIVKVVDHTQTEGLIAHDVWQYGYAFPVPIHFPS